MMAALVVCGVSAQNSKHAIGGRVGDAVEFVYQYHMNDKNFIEADLGIVGYNTVALSATYNWNVGRWDWTPNAGSWGLYVGPGLALGYCWNHLYWTNYGYKNNNTALNGRISDIMPNSFMVGVKGLVGFYFNLKDGPWTFAVDYAPIFGLCAGERWHKDGTLKGGASFYREGLYNFGLKAIYRF